MRELIALADFFDERGLSKEADDVDKMIKERWESAGQRPPEGMGTLCNTSWRDAFEYLKKSMIEMNSVGSIKLDTDTAQQFLHIISVVSDELDRQCKETQKTPTERAVEKAEKVYYVSPQVVTLSENIATLSEDIRKGNEKIESGSFIGDETADDVMRGIKEDQDRLSQNLQTLNTMATPDEIAASQEFVAALTSGQRGSVVLVPERRQEQGRRREDV